MFEWIESGRIVDAILVGLFVEAMLLFGLRRFLGLGPGLGDIAANLAAGVFLLLALRAALTNANGEWIAIWLAAALIAHLGDITLRWVQSSVEASGTAGGSGPSAS